MKYSQINWKSAFAWLRQKQTLLLKMYKEGDLDEVRRIQVSILKDFRTTSVAVRRVSSNTGSSTSGVDGLIAKTHDELGALASKAHYVVCNPSTYKASTVKRVWMTEGLNDKRPLGILTTLDRTVQAIYLEAIDPIVECHSCENSYGFRKFRSAQDAVLALRGKLIHPKASEWVLNADIAKFFDNIDHDYLLRNVPVYRNVDRKVLREMLKAGIIHNSDITMPDFGTPQGGILSPVLANIALNGLEEMVKQRAAELHKKLTGRKGNPKVHIVRYVDDFIVVGPSKKTLLFLILCIKKFLSERGLKISDEKTSLVNIWESDVLFLGFSFKKRRFNYRKRIEISWNKTTSKSTSRIIIWPSARNQLKFKTKVRDITRSHSDLSTLIIKLNEYLRNWAYYFAATSDSAERVRKLHRFVLRLCWLKVLKKYPLMTRKQIKRRFFPKHKFYQLGRHVSRAWVFSAPTKLERPSSKFARLRLFNLDSVRAPGTAILPKGLNAYSEKDLIRLEKRKPRFSSSTVEKVCAKQKFICPVCGQSLGNGEEVELHHSPSLKDLRLDSSPNKRVKLIALHKLCHRKVHKSDKTKDTNGL